MNQSMNSLFRNVRRRTRATNSANQTIVRSLAPVVGAVALVSSIGTGAEILAASTRPDNGFARQVFTPQPAGGRPGQIHMDIDDVQDHEQAAQTGLDHDSSTIWPNGSPLADTNLQPGKLRDVAVGHGPVTIDIKPDTDDCLSLHRDDYGVPVAIIGGSAIDVGNIDLGRLSLAIDITADAENPWCLPMDMNGDDVYDLVCNFENWATGADDLGTLEGQMLNGEALEANDTICIRP